jgi:acyl-CoA dehydrogenase
VRRHVFNDDHEHFRKVMREFMLAEASPVVGEWEAQGYVPRSFFTKLGELGVVGMSIPEAYGGGGVSDYRYNVVLQEEASRALVPVGPLSLQLDVVLPYFLAYADEEQRARWLPGIAAGEILTAIAMTEPGTGSDVAGIRTEAARDGDYYILNGSKTFISCGHIADLVIVVARTDQDDSNRRGGLTLLVVEDGMTGFEKGRVLDKIGLHSQDTVELSFEDVQVPVTNRLGEEGHGFSYLGHNLAQERLAIGVSAVAQSRVALELTIDYVKQRTVFGQSVSSFQNTRFELAAVATEIGAAQSLLDRALTEHVAGELDGTGAAMTKLFCTEVQGRVVDRCLQLFGGYGYINEYPIARLYRDARVARIYGGTSEVMKSIIGRSLGL